jgi:hypothetical protein
MTGEAQGGCNIFQLERCGYNLYLFLLMMAKDVGYETLGDRQARGMNLQYLEACAGGRETPDLLDIGGRGSILSNTRADQRMQSHTFNCLPVYHILVLVTPT